MRFLNEKKQDLDCNPNELILKTNKMLNLLKKWYTLYIAVSTIIIIQSVVFEFINIYSFNTSLLTFYNILFSSLLLTSLWFFVKQIVENKIKFAKEIKELKNFKRNNIWEEKHFYSINTNIKSKWQHES